MRMPIADGSLEIATGRGAYVAVLMDGGVVHYWTAEDNLPLEPERLTGVPFEILAVAIPEGNETRAPRVTEPSRLSKKSSPVAAGDGSHDGRRTLENGH